MNFPIISLPDNVLKQILKKTSLKTRCRLRKSHKKLDSVLWFSQKIINFPLASFSGKLLKQILAKTYFTTLCRLRKSSKKLDTFVEENRRSIRAVAVDDLPDEFVGLPTQTTFLEQRRLNIIFCISTQAICFTVGGRNNRGPPFTVSPKSLSAIYFKMILFDIWEYPDGAFNYSHSLEDLKEAHFSCEDLTLFSRIEVDEETIEKLISPITFSKLWLETCCTPFRFLHNPNIQNCEEVYVDMIEEIPRNVSSVLRHVQIETLELMSEWLDLPIFVHSILEALKEDNGAIGKIKHMRLLAYKRNFACFSQYLVWEGEVATYMDYGEPRGIRKDHCCFYIVEVNGGIVLMNHISWFFNVMLIKNNIRETLVYRILEVLTRWMPCDYSSIWNELITTTELPGTIENVMRNFHAEYLFKPMRP